MVDKKAQAKAGIPEQRRGQQMGDAAHPDHGREEMNKTPALRGRRKKASEMFADQSSQHVGGDMATPRSNTPSVPGAMPARGKAATSGGRKTFNKRSGRK